MHFAAAGTWIASSLVFYGVVGAFNRAYSAVNRGIIMKVVWCLNVVSAILFLTFIIIFNVGGRNADIFTAAGINEYITAFLILTMDYLLAHSIHSRFLQGANLFSGIVCF